jgi:hypothetical protein
MTTLTKTNVRLFASAKSRVEGEAVRQLYAAANFDGMRLAVGFPDLHPGKGSPVGAALVSDGIIYPYLKVATALEIEGEDHSATLVLQTVLPSLLTASATSTLILEGGTHNPLAPPFDFLARSFMPLIH